MDSSDYVVRSPGGDAGVVARPFGAETLLVPVCGGVGDLDSVYTLNEAGTIIWNAIAAPTRIEQLVATVAGEYEVGVDRVREDVHEFLAELAQLRLIAVSAVSQ
jgi:hypothetical protein